MTATEPARHALYSRLEDVLGIDHADTLMTYLPQDRGDEVATKADLARLDETLDARFTALDDRFDRMEDRFNRLEERMDRMQRFYVGTTVGSMTALTAIFSLVVWFLG